MLVAIDVGNTETKLGLFDDGVDRLAHRWRVTTDHARTADEYGIAFTQLFAAVGLVPSVVDAVAIASVVPKLDPVLAEACRHYFNAAPWFLRPHEQTQMSIETDRPVEVGADLVATALGGRARYGSPLIVVSYGTATVFTAVSATGAYLGGAIAPGIAISLDALVGRTAKLPQIAFESPRHAIGRNTVDALRSGTVYGFVGQTEAIVARMRSELGGQTKAIATGGLAEIVASHTDAIDAVEPHLSLEGLRLFANHPPTS